MSVVYLPLFFDVRCPVVDDVRRKSVVFEPGVYDVVGGVEVLIEIGEDLGGGGVGGDQAGFGRQVEE